MISVRRYASSLRHSEADLSISYCFISWPCEYPGLSFQRSPVCACSLVSSLLLSGATMSQQPSLTQSAHSVRQVLTAYRQGITYGVCKTPKSDLFRDLLPLLNSRHITLPQHNRLIA